MHHLLGSSTMGSQAFALAHTASDQVPRIVQRKGERTEAGKGNGSKTAKGSKHAGEQTNGQGEPHNDQEGEGRRTPCRGKAGGQASTQ